MQFPFSSSTCSGLKWGRNLHLHNLHLHKGAVVINMLVITSFSLLSICKLNASCRPKAACTRALLSWLKIHIKFRLSAKWHSQWMLHKGPSNSLSMESECLIDHSLTDHRCRPCNGENSFDRLVVNGVASTIEKPFGGESLSLWTVINAESRAY